MPKITGPNIAEHVATQEAAIFSVATRLFAEHGVNDVAMGSIAEAVGLARPSLYRYFPTKASIVVRWFERTIAPLIERSDAIARSDLPAVERFEAWFGLQLDFLAEPDHQAMIRASLDANDLTDGDRATIATRHVDLYRSLSAILGDAGTPPDSVEPRAHIIAAIARSIIDLTSRGTPMAMARTELLRAATRTAGLREPEDPRPR